MTEETKLTQPQDPDCQIHSPEYEALKNIVIVLVEPLYPGNIGQTARAMKNFSLSDLRLVHPPLDREGDAYRMAHGARDVLKNAMRTFTLEEAVADCGYIVGTTARLGGWRQETATPRASAGRILEIARKNKTAILFGSEDRGLSNESIKMCRSLLTIPTGEFSSLNIAQAVLLISYEIFSASAATPAVRVPKLAPAPNVERMVDDLRDSLILIDFLKPGNPDYWMQAFKRIFGRNGLETREVNLWHGVARQIRWAAQFLPDAAGRFGRLKKFAEMEEDERCGIKSEDRGITRGTGEPE